MVGKCRNSVKMQWRRVSPPELLSLWKGGERGRVTNRSGQSSLSVAAYSCPLPSSSRSLALDFRCGLSLPCWAHTLSSRSPAKQEPSLLKVDPFRGSPCAHAPGSLDFSLCPLITKSGGVGWVGFLPLFSFFVFLLLWNLATIPEICA